MFVDSHCHLQLMDYAELKLTQDEVVKLAASNNVTRLLNVATTFTDYPELKAIAERYACVDISVGLHPNEVITVEPTIDDYIEYAQDNRVVAIGETGLDFYRDTASSTLQIARFINQITVAKELRKPLIIHTRAASLQTIEVLKQQKADQVGGVIHCFTENLDFAKQAIDLGFMISFSGIVTFKNAVDLQHIATILPIEHILIETDSPYLAPAPYRGKINQPSHVTMVAEFIAKLKGTTVEYIAERTTENYFRMFG